MFGERVAERLRREARENAAAWLERLRELLPVDDREVFPTRDLLDHVPMLIARVADRLREDAPLDFGADTPALEKARELGRLRHAQGASVHQILREYDLLADVLGDFVERQAERSGPNDPAEVVRVLRRLERCLRILVRTTIDTFVERYEATIAQQTEQLRQFNRAISHELRNPLNALEVCVGLLEDDEAGESRERVLALVGRSVRRASHLVRSLETLSHLRAEPQDTPSRQEVSLAALARDVGEELSAMADARGVEVTVDPALPEVEANVARLEMVLSNLISNAIKYSDPDASERWVRVEAPPEGEDGRIVFVVRDNGIGLPPGKRRELFTPFFRGHPERDAELGIRGSGLGLSIVKECLAVLEGRIDLESREGEGTRVVISLPR